MTVTVYLDTPIFVLSYIFLLLLCCNDYIVLLLYILHHFYILDIWDYVLWFIVDASLLKVTLLIQSSRSKHIYVATYGVSKSEVHFDGV